MLDKGLFLNAVNYGSRLRKKVVGGPKAVDIRQDSRVSRVWRGLGLLTGFPTENVDLRPLG